MTNPNPSPIGIGFGFVLFGAGGGTRTHTPGWITDFESVSSANSDTPAKITFILYRSIPKKSRNLSYIFFAR